MNAKEGEILRLILEELGHPQPPTPIHCNIKTAAGIANDTVEKYRSRWIEIRVCWITDQVKQNIFDVQWHPRQGNLGDYYTKAFDGKHHREVRPWYLHEKNLPRFLPRTSAPQDLRWCVGTLANRYIKSVPLPQLGLGLRNNCGPANGYHHGHEGHPSGCWIKGIICNFYVCKYR